MVSMGYISRMMAKNGFSEIEVKDGQNKVAGMEVSNRRSGIKKWVERKKGMGRIKVRSGLEWK
jgi:hypothetical protein